MAKNDKLDPLSEPSSDNEEKYMEFLIKVKTERGNLDHNV